jgi:tRNA threonylcarbamoyl adenosine modification protein YeaZ
MTPPAAAGADLLLALHSSSETLGLGLEPLGRSDASADPSARRLACFPLGRALSNELFACVETLLPVEQWPRLARLAVAIGPGGFTGTRLTVVLARTLAQQLGVPLDGSSSFLLSARRLRRSSEAPREGFWLVQPLPRHGLVAGLYGPDGAGGLGERLVPRLYREEQELRALADLPLLPAEPRLPEDVAELLDLSQAAAAAGVAAPWQPVLPLYPTSPVAAEP